MPPEPAILTPGESLILGYLRAGVFDAELAVRLGLSVGQVKDRIAALMTRAAVSTRAELLAWDGATAEPIAPAPLLAPTPPLAGTGSGPALGGARRFAFALVAVVALLTAVAWWVLAAGSSESKPAALAAPTAPPGLSTGARPAPAATVGSRAPTIPLAVLPPATLPAGLVLYVLAGCNGCDGPPAGINRVFRDSSGAVQQEALFVPDAANGETIVSAWASEDAADMLVAVCIRGSCGPGNRATVLPDSLVKLLRSRDGGISWANFGEIPGGIEVLGSRRDGEVLLQRWSRVGPGLSGLETSFLLYPSGLVLSPPPGAAPGRQPFVYAGSTVGWYSNDGEAILDGAGAVAQGWLPGEPKRIVQVEPRTRTADTWAFRWYPESPYPEQNDVVTRIGEALADGSVRRVVEYIGSPLRLGPWVGSHTMIVMIDVKPWRVVFRLAPGNDLARLPAILDFERATITPLAEPFGSGKNDVLAAVSGDFLRIGAVEGCVLVLVAPRNDRDPLGCLKPGSIAGIVSVRLPIEGEPWIIVRTPSGRQGWVRGDQPGLELLTECTSGCGRALAGAKGDRP